MTGTDVSTPPSRFRPALILGLAYAVCGPAIGAVVLTLLGSALDWQPETTMSPAAAYIVIAFVSGALPLFVAGAAAGWLVPPLERGRAIRLSVGVAVVVGAVWGGVGGLSHPEDSLWVSVLEVAFGCAVVAAICSFSFGNIRMMVAADRGQNGAPR